MKKLKKYMHTNILLLLLLLIIIGCISSCRDEITSSSSINLDSTIKDSSVYDWRFVEFSPGFVYDLYASDTNQIFIASYSGTYYFNGHNFSQIDINSSEFFVNVLAGEDNNNVYLGGGGIGQFINHSRLKKWNGTSVQEIQMPDDTTLGVSSIFINSSNDIWITTKTNKLYHFDGINNFTDYYLPQIDAFETRGIFKSHDQNLYLLGWVPMNNLVHYLGKSYVFRYENGNWILVFIDSVFNNTELKYDLNIINNDVIRRGQNYVHFFTPSGWQQISSFVSFDCTFAGESRYDFISNALSKNGKYDIYFYKSEQWYRDTNYIPPEQNNYNCVKYSCFIKNCYVGFYEYPGNYLIIGKPKSNVNK